MMTNKILITGATGNVGREVVRELHKRGAPIVAAASDQEDARRFFEMETETAYLNFGDSTTYEPALVGVNRLFLMRPPAIADVGRYLHPFVDAAIRAGVNQIVFLSLMGVEQNKRVPHYQTEQYLKASGVPYTLLRPSYFMQNLDTQYRAGIRDRSEIFIPAWWGKTSFIDVRDIGAVAAKVLTEPGHEFKAYALTGEEALNYFQVAKIMTEVLGRKITYRNPSHRKFATRMREQGVSEEFIEVMKMLYWPIRLGLGGGLTSEVFRLLGRKPYTMRQYVSDYAERWIPEKASI